MKVALVTGGTKGIGLAVAKKLQKSGYTPVINYFSDDVTAKKVENDYGIKAYKADVSDEKAVNKMVSDIISRYGKIDVLVNSAGIALKQKTLLDVDYEEMQRCISVNLAGTILTTKAVLTGMISSGGGVIVNVSSVYGNTGGSCEAVYSATKGGINAFTKAIAKEFSSANIRVNAVAPGFIDTEMNVHISAEDKNAFCEDLLVKRIGTPEDVASAVYFLIENTYISGTVLSVDGGMSV